MVWKGRCLSRRSPQSLTALRSGGPFFPAQPADAWSRNAGAPGFVFIAEDTLTLLVAVFIVKPALRRTTRGFAGEMTGCRIL
jgi:hypothetical protein